MKFTITLVVMGLAALAVVLGEEVTPITKVLEMLTKMQERITQESEKEQKTHEEIKDWCEDEANHLDRSIKSAKETIAKHNAIVEEELALGASLATKVDETSGTIASLGDDLKSAADMRDAEAADFKSQSNELSDVIDMMDRAIQVLERNAKSGGAALPQLSDAGTVAQALATMVQASVLSSADAGRLTALVQNSDASTQGDGDMDIGAPAANAYEGQSSVIIETLVALREKAQMQLSEAQKAEGTAVSNFALLKLTLEDQIKFAQKDMDRAKANLAASAEKKAHAQGELQVTQKTLASDEATREDLHNDCMTRAQDHNAAMHSREEELNALAAAKKAIQESTGSAEDVTYSFTEASFLQVRERGRFAVVRRVRELAKKLGSVALAQLASRMATDLTLSGRYGADPFRKVKDLLNSMIERLEKEATSEANQKTYCDKELSATSSNRGEKETDLEKLSTKIDQMTSQSAKLKEDVAVLQADLAQLAKSQAEMDKLRESEHKDFLSAKAALERGIEGIKLALRILRNYYAKPDKSHSADEGGSSGLLAMLEVCESDFSKGLAAAVAAEEGAQADYEEQTKQNELDKVAKGQEVQYKGKESAALDKAVADATNDRAGVQAELDAIVDYLKKLREMCVAKAEPYEQRADARSSEIAGLKEALKSLSNKDSFFQASSNLRLRGSTALHSL